MTLKLPDRFAEEFEGLGEPVAVFKTGIFLYVYAAIVLLLVGGLFLFFTIFPLFAGARAMQNALPDMKVVFAGITALTGGAIILRKTWKWPRLSVFAFQHGLACMERRKLEIVLWKDVNRVIRVDESNKLSSSRAPGDGLFQVILVLRDGRQLVFNESLSQFRIFPRLVKEHTLPHMLPPALEAYNAGATIGFGDVSVSSEGIHKGQDTLPWDQFERGEVSKGRLLLYSRSSKKPFGRVELANVSNVHVLLALTDHVRGQRP